jgi:polysaccharide deacetylase 2 family uncharacterized protein YibQ
MRRAPLTAPLTRWSRRLWARHRPAVRLAGVAVVSLVLGVAIGVGVIGHAPPTKAPHPRETPIARLPPEPHVMPPPEAPPQAPPQAVLPPQPEAPVATRPQPAWLRYAVAPPPVEGRPMVAIVIDDLGLDRKRTQRAIALKPPLTLSFMTYAEDLPQQTAAAHHAGHELLLHVPMQAVDAHEDAGPNGLLVSLGHDEILRRLRWGLDRFPGYVGINNHMGSRFTADTAGMTPVIDELHERGLLFLDSRTTAATVAETIARREGVPNAARDVFLDDEQSASAIGARLADVERIARRRGSVIAIGHAHDATLAALAEWLATLDARHLALVPLSTIVRQRGAAG